MASEKEIWSRISQKDFNKFLNSLKEEIGEPKYTKRLAIQATDYDRQDLDTRVRITNGTAEIMQKKGGWADETRVEISTPLSSDATVILDAYRTIRNMLGGNNIETSVIQTENFVFETDKYEVKLTHQSGKCDVYNYEIEVYDHDLNPKDIVVQIGIPIDSPESTPEFWREWNSTVNLMADQLEKEDLHKLIESYL